jgi:hypothetical protein
LRPSMPEICCGAAAGPSASGRPCAGCCLMVAGSGPR